LSKHLGLKSIVLISLAIWLGYSPDLQAEVKMMPEELVEVAQRERCAQIVDFFEGKPGPLDASFVYGYLPGDREDSAVFWCRNLESKETPYSLVFHFKDREHELTKCPDKIQWKNPPRGLSVYLNQKETLSGFRYLADPRRKVPTNHRFTHAAVRSYYDGVEELFYCHNGEWLVRERH